MRGFWSRDVFNKSLDSEFVSIHNMTPADWRVLEFENLRNRAKNRIAKMIIDGELIGFYRVNVIEKAKAKSRYFQPVSDVTIEDEHGGFAHEEDDEVLSDDAEAVNMILSDMARIPVASIALLLIGPRLFNLYSAGRTKEELRQQIEEMDPLDVDLYMLAVLTEEYGDQETIRTLYKAGLITRKTYEELYWVGDLDPEEAIDLEAEGADEGPE